MAANSESPFVTASVGQSKILVEDLAALKLLTGYKPDEEDSVQEGFILGEPVLNERNIMIYPPGKEITHVEISRLEKLQETSPAFRPKFSIQKNVKLIGRFRDELKDDFRRLIESKKRRDKYAQFMLEVEKSLEYYIQDILESEDIVYTLSQMKLKDHQLSKDDAARASHFTHSINTLLYSLGIAKNSHKMTNFRASNHVELAKVALFHNINIFEHLTQLNDLESDSLVRQYLEINKKSYSIVQYLGVSPEIVSAVRAVNEYYFGGKDFVKNSDLVSHFANIVLIADIFDQRESGLLMEPIPMRNVIDGLYTRAASGEIKKVFLDALAQGLKLKPLVDFYAELDRIRNSCYLKDPQKYPAAYPMTGFQSAVVFICKEAPKNCPFYGGSKAVTVFKSLPGLRQGSYGICLKMTKDLRDFYNKHYDDIKEVSRNKDQQS